MWRFPLNLNLPSLEGEGVLRRMLEVTLFQGSLLDYTAVTVAVEEHLSLGPACRLYRQPLPALGWVWGSCSCLCITHIPVSKPPLMLLKATTHPHTHKPNNPLARQARLGRHPLFRPRRLKMSVRSPAPKLFSSEYFRHSPEKLANSERHYRISKLC